MTSDQFAGEAVHEAGHAVMARLLGLGLKRVHINLAEASGRTCVVWPGAHQDPRKNLRILAAARACMRAFDKDTFHEEGGIGDEGAIRTILDEICEDDEAVRINCINTIDAELSTIFGRADVRAAALALAEILTETGELDGSRAEAIIDHHLSHSVGAS